MNETTLESKLKTLTYIVIGGFVVTILLIVGLYFQVGDNNSTEGDYATENQNGGSGSGSQTGDETSTYDTSKLTKVDGEGAVQLFKDKKTHILIVGRKGCGVCQAYIPNVNQFVDETKVEVNYLELVIATYKTDFADLFDYLDIETSINSGGETYEGTYGELLEEHGFTPLTFVIKNGKLVDAYVGSRTADTMKTFMSKYMDID